MEYSLFMNSVDCVEITFLVMNGAQRSVYSPSYNLESSDRKQTNLRSFGELRSADVRPKTYLGMASRSDFRKVKHFPFDESHLKFPFPPAYQTFSFFVFSASSGLPISRHFPWSLVKRRKK